MVTIYDIAEKTGFTAPTVSKALNGTGKLKEETRTAILKVAEEMGYNPNMVARTLTTKKSNLIGVIYDDVKMLTGFDHPLFGGVLTKFRAKVEDSGYDIVFLSRTFKMSYLTHAQFRSVDAVAAINPDINDNLTISELVKNGIPCVSTNDHIPEICTVVTDNEKGGYDAAKYLLSKGHKKIAFLGGPHQKTSPATVERFTGLKKCLAENNIEFNQDLYEECDLWNTESGYNGFERLWNRNKDFTAIFASDDDLAFGIMKFAEENNIALPQKLCIIGFDDDKIASFCCPSLTTFKQNKDAIGETAADILLSLIAGSTAPEIVKIPAEFIERDSVIDVKDMDL